MLTVFFSLVFVKKNGSKRFCGSEMAAWFVRGLMGDGSGSRRFVPSAVRGDGG